VAQQVKDLMVQNVVMVRPETPLVEAAEVITKNDFTGLPVSDSEGRLLGLLTEYDLISRGTSLHLPTLSKLLSGASFYKSDKELLLPEVKSILELKVSDVMNKEPLTLSPNSMISEAVQLFAEHHAVNPVPVIDETRKVVGILARFDIVKLWGSANPGPETHTIAQREGGNEAENFLEQFNKRFVLVSKARTRWWLVASMLFGAVGFIIAFAIILRLTS